VISLIIEKIAELTEEDLGKISESTVLSELEAWDSLAMVTFLVFASTEFGVELTGKDLRKAVTVSDLHNLIRDSIKNDKN